MCTKSPRSLCVLIKLIFCSKEATVNVDVPVQHVTVKKMQWMCCSEPYIMFHINVNVMWLENDNHNHYFHYIITWYLVKNVLILVYFLCVNLMIFLNYSLPLPLFCRSHKLAATSKTVKLLSVALNIISRVLHRRETSLTVSLWSTSLYWKNETWTTASSAAGQ